MKSIKIIIVACIVCLLGSSIAFAKSSTFFNLVNGGFINNDNICLSVKMSSYYQSSHHGGVYYNCRLNDKYSGIFFYYEGNVVTEKGFYCLCANLFPLDELKIIMLNIGKLFKDTTVERKEKIIIIREVFEKRAKELNIEIKLRK